MFAKLSRTHWKVLAAFFSTVLAPLGVRVVESALRGEPATPSAFVSTNNYVAPAVEVAPLPAATQVVVQGTGPTADEAFHNAVDTAVRHAVAAQVDAVTWKQHGPEFMLSVRRDGTGVIRGWRELSNTSERHLTGKVYRSEVAVEVDAEALRERLTPARRP